MLFYAEFLYTVTDKSDLCVRVCDANRGILCLPGNKNVEKHKMNVRFSYEYEGIRRNSKLTVCFLVDISRLAVCS
jgi:hypothetical protein